MNRLRTGFVLLSACALTAAACSTNGPDRARAPAAARAPEARAPRTSAPQPASPTPSPVTTPLPPPPPLPAPLWTADVSKLSSIVVHGNRVLVTSGPFAHGT